MLRLVAVIYLISPMYIKIPFRAMLTTVLSHLKGVRMLSVKEDLNIYDFREKWLVVKKKCPRHNRMGAITML